MPFEMFPGESTVSRFIKSATGTAAGEGPRLTAHLIHRRIDDAGVLRIEHYIDSARVLVFIENLLPGLSAVGGAKHAAFFIRSPGVAECSHQNDVRVARVNDQCADMARVFQSEVLPTLTTVGGFVDAVTIRDVAAQAGFAGSHVEDVVVSIGNSDGSDGRDILLVKSWCPGHATVGAFENPAGHGSKVISVRVAGNSGYGEHATAAKGADLPPLHTANQGLINLTVGREYKGQNKGERKAETSGHQ